MLDSGRDWQLLHTPCRQRQARIKFVFAGLYALAAWLIAAFVYPHSATLVPYLRFALGMVGLALLLAVVKTWLLPRFRRRAKRDRLLVPDLRHSLNTPETYSRSRT